MYEDLGEVPPEMTEVVGHVLDDQSECLVEASQRGVRLYVGTCVDNRYGDSPYLSVRCEPPEDASLDPTT